MKKRKQHIHSVICHSCDFVCKTKNPLSIHLKSHVKCSFCNRNFGGHFSKKDLKFHLKSCAPHLIPEPKYSCQNCHKTFEFKSKFNEHMTNTKCGKGEKGENDTIICSGAKKKRHPRWVIFVIEIKTTLRVYVRVFREINFSTKN